MLPVIIFALALMSVVSIAALLTASDEFHSAQALRESSEAFYAAEAGLNQIWGNWPKSQVATLQPGDSLDLGWETLNHGAMYRAVIYRYDVDDGKPELYGLVVEGRGSGPRGGQKVLSLTLTQRPGSGGYMLGACCDAAVTTRGTVTMKDQVLVDGHDEHPANWEDAGVCADSLYDRSGLIMQDTTLLTLKSEATLDGEIPLEQRMLTDAHFDQFGELTWEQIKAKADHVIDATAKQWKPDQDDIYPRYNWVNGEKVCDTSHPNNWGSNDPTDPCFNYFPILLIKGEVETHDIYGQAVVIIDWDESSGIGGEFELEDNSVFNGIILGKGCVEIQKSAIFHGSVFTDGNYRNEDLCGSDDDYAMNKDGTEVHFSQCAVDRAMEATGLADFAEATLTGGGITTLGSRGFTEQLR